MKTVDIKGKKYVEVHERVKYFRDNFKDWTIETEIKSIESGVCIIKAIILNENGIIKSTGHAYEKENSSFINKTSYIENCETSAVGRALGFLNIGIDTSIATSEEVQNAIKQQSKKLDDVLTDDKRIDYIIFMQKYNATFPGKMKQNIDKTIVTKNIDDATFNRIVIGYQKYINENYQTYQDFCKGAK